MPANRFRQYPADGLSRFSWSGLKATAAWPFSPIPSCWMWATPFRRASVAHRVHRRQLLRPSLWPEWLPELFSHIEACIFRLTPQIDTVEPVSIADLGIMMGVWGLCRSICLTTCTSRFISAYRWGTAECLYFWGRPSAHHSHKSFFIKWLKISNANGPTHKWEPSANVCGLHQQNKSKVGNMRCDEQKQKEIYSRKVTPISCD